LAGKVRRGDIVIMAGGGPYAGKPRPAVIVQSDDFELPSMAVCLITTENVGAPLARIAIEPNQTNGLNQPSWIMVDKIASLPRRRFGRTIGRLTDEQLLALNRALSVFLGLAGA
jgi:mRNA interferase MazF